MDTSYYTNPLIFVIQTLFSLYILAVMLRFILQWANADFYNPISQFLVKITHPPLRMLRRFIPAMGRIDTAAIVLMLGLQMLSFFLIWSLRGVSASAGALAILSLAELVSLFINVFIIAILIRVILSWVNPGAYNSATSLLHSLTEPLLKSIRGIIPSMQGLDFAPIVAFFALQLAKMLVLPPLNQAAALLN